MRSSRVSVDPWLLVSARCSSWHLARMWPGLTAGTRCDHSRPRGLRTEAVSAQSTAIPSQVPNSHSCQSARTDALPRRTTMIQVSGIPVTAVPTASPVSSARRLDSADTSAGRWRARGALARCASIRAPISRSTLLKERFHHGVAVLRAELTMHLGRSAEFVRGQRRGSHSGSVALQTFRVWQRGCPVWICRSCALFPRPPDRCRGSCRGRSVSRVALAPSRQRRALGRALDDDLCAATGCPARGGRPGQSTTAAGHRGSVTACATGLRVRAS